MLTELVELPGGSFRMGSTQFYPEEVPVHTATVGALAVERHPVTNAQFAEFVADTGYVTVAEQELDPALYPGAAPQDLVPGALVFSPTAARSTCATGGSGGTGCPAPAGGIRSARTASSTIGSIIRWCRSPIPTPPPTRAGPVAGCRPKPSGSTRRVAAPPPPIRGAMTSRRADG